MTAGMLKYRRVCQRLREKFGASTFSIKELENAIFIECGTDPRTVAAAIDRMLRMDLIIAVQEERQFGLKSEKKFKLTPTHDEFF
jgi:hypothetical protein